MGFATTLTAAQDVHSLLLSAADPFLDDDSEPVQTEFLVQIDEEFELVQLRGGQVARPWQVTRGAFGTTPADHDSGAAVTQVIPFPQTVVDGLPFHDAAAQWKADSANPVFGTDGSGAMTWTDNDPGQPDGAFLSGTHVLDGYIQIYTGVGPTGGTGTWYFPLPNVIGGGAQDIVRLLGTWDARDADDITIAGGTCTPYPFTAGDQGIRLLDQTGALIDAGAAWFPDGSHGVTIRISYSAWVTAD